MRSTFHDSFDEELFLSSKMIRFTEYSRFDFEHFVFLTTIRNGKLYNEQSC